MKKGSVNRKIIAGRPYYYLQYRENGRAKSKTLSLTEACQAAYEIYTGEKHTHLIRHKYKSQVFFGEKLLKETNKAASYKKRHCYAKLKSFVDNPSPGRVYVLYGLRRTGKTTMMLQSIAELTLKELVKTAYLVIKPGETFDDLLDDLDYLSDMGIMRFYIDEITLLDDFITMSATLADIYGMMGTVVLSGTDSLGFLFASHQELYDRTRFLHTTYISYKEWSDVLNLKGIDKYIEFGGTMSLEGADYNRRIANENGSFYEYVDSSIANNITHSLKNYNRGDHFMSLYSLYEKGVLPSIINRLVEDNNHRFAISTIATGFKSHDYGSLKNLIKKPRNKDLLGHSLDGIDEASLINSLLESLDIASGEQRLDVDEKALKLIKEYLRLLDVIYDIDEVSMVDYSTEKKTVFIQPGLRYAQAKALVKALESQPSFQNLPGSLADGLVDKMLSDIRGRMMEEIVLASTSMVYPKTFKAVFPVGEFDMCIIKDEECEIYEIKHSDQPSPYQLKYLNDKDMLERFESHYYPIKKKAVIYRGKTALIDGIEYINVEDYLNSL